MRVRSGFTVKMSGHSFYLGIIGIGCAALVFIVQMIFNRETTNFALMFLFFFPYLLMNMWLILMAKVFRITVNKNTISVRTWMGRKYHFDVSDVEHVEWKKALNNYVYTEQIKIKTLSGKKVKVEKLMDGFGSMADFISANVDASKIHSYYTVYKPPAEISCTEKEGSDGLAGGRKEEAGQEEKGAEEEIV